MKYCVKCGKEIMDEAVICPGCGCAVSPTRSNNTLQSTEDKASGGLIALSILIPLAGIIIACINWNTTPNAARTYLKAALITMAITAVLYGIIYGVVLSSYI